MDNSSASHSRAKVSRTSIIVCVTVLSLLAALIAWSNFKLHFNGFIRNDNHEYCEIARNFYEGNGYSTSVLRPMAYKFFTTLPQPEVTRMPIYPYFLSLSFHILGPNDITIVIFNSIFFVALVAITFLVAFELSQNILISLMTALITASMQAFFRDTITAEPNIFFTVMFLIFIYLYLKFPSKIFLHGIALAVLYLIRANTLFVFAAFCIALFISGKSWKERFSSPFVLTAGFAIGLVPYMIRNYLVIGKPFFSLYSYSFLLLTKSFPLYTIWTIIPNVDPTAYALSHPSEMIQKAYFFFFSLINDFIAVYKPVFLLLLGVGFFLPSHNPRLKFLKLVIIAGFIIQTILLLPVGPVAYYYIFFFPLMISLASINTKERLKQYAPVVLLCALAVLIYGTVPFWKSPKPANPFPAIGRQIAELTDKNDIILTDIPWEISWYANRRTLWLPLDINTLTTISRTLKPKYILIIGYMYAPYKDNIWPRIAHSPDVAKAIGYRVVKPILFANRPIALLYESTE